MRRSNKSIRGRKLFEKLNRGYKDDVDLIITD
jgi:hypothetical protein